MSSSLFFAVAAAAAWPLAAQAQQPERMRLIGVFPGSGRERSRGKVRYAAFQQGLQGNSGCIDGHNVRIDRRWGEGKADLMRRQAAELVALMTLAGGHSDHRRQRH